MLKRLSYTYTHAIVRKPARSCVKGLRAVGADMPNYDLFLKQHAAYISALEAQNVRVDIIPAAPDYPDSMFIEDMALCLPQGAVILNTATPSRMGEENMVREHLKKRYGERVYELESTADNFEMKIEGGDILRTDREIIVGMSQRTNMAGANALRKVIARWGLNVRTVDTPKDVLHFKSGSAMLGDGVVLCTANLASSGIFRGYDLLVVPNDEVVPANVMRVNRAVFIVSGYPKTERSLRLSGYQVVVLDVSEARKLDAGLSCMSLRFDPNQYAF